MAKRAQRALQKQRGKVLEPYETGAVTRKEYLLKRQRKNVLEQCRRIAVVGANADPSSSSYVSIEKLLGTGLEIFPVFSDREAFLGVRCYRGLNDVPGTLDVVQVYAREYINLVLLAREALDKGVRAFWVENGVAGPEVEEMLVKNHVQLIEREELVTEYLKHYPVATVTARPRVQKRATVFVRDRMVRNPLTVTLTDGINKALTMMERGHFRHLPVVDEKGKLVGMLSDRDIRLIRPSLALESPQDAMVQMWSLSVQQAAVFDPITVKPETPLVEAAQVMLRWRVGGLPVVDEIGKLVGILTYTDILREYASVAETE